MNKNTAAIYITQRVLMAILVVSFYLPFLAFSNELLAPRELREDGTIVVPSLVLPLSGLLSEESQIELQRIPKDTAETIAGMAQCGEFIADDILGNAKKRQCRASYYYTTPAY